MKADLQGRKLEHGRPVLGLLVLYGVLLDRSGKQAPGESGICHPHSPGPLRPRAKEKCGFLVHFQRPFLPSSDSPEAVPSCCALNLQLRGNNARDRKVSPPESRGHLPLALQRLLVPRLQIEACPLLLTLMNLMVSWHAKAHGHLLCWQHAHIDGGVTCSDGGGVWIATKERFKNRPSECSQWCLLICNKTSW